MHVEINCIRNLPIPNNYKEIERGKRVTVSPLYLSDALCESFILCFICLKWWVCVLDWVYLLCMKSSFKYFDNTYNHYSSILVIDCFDIIEYLHVLMFFAWYNMWITWLRFIHKVFFNIFFIIEYFDTHSNSFSSKKSISFYFLAKITSGNRLPY